MITMETSCNRKYIPNSFNDYNGNIKGQFNTPTLKPNMYLSASMSLPSTLLS